MSEVTENAEMTNLIETLEQALSNKMTIKVGRNSIVLDPKAMVFNEANLSVYLEHEHSWYDHFGKNLALAEAEMQQWELKAEAKQAGKLAQFKDEGSSDKLAESKAKSDAEVVDLKQKCITARAKVRLIQQHLRAWDKAHENAQNRGNTLRKEMDKLNNDIRMSRSMEGKVDDIIGGLNTES